MGDEKTITLAKGEGRAFWMLNGLYEIKVSAAESGGALTVMEMTLPEGWGPPLHTHDCTENMYVLDGTVRLHMNGATYEAGPGSFVHLPAGTVERPEPVGTAHILMTYVPGGIDQFFAEVGAPAPTHELPPLSDQPPDIARIVEAGARYGMAFPQP